MSNIIVTDIAGTAGTVTIDAYDFYETVSTWVDVDSLPRAEGVLVAISEIVTSPVWSADLDEYERFLGIRIGRVS